MTINVLTFAMMMTKPPTPDQIIRMAGCADADNIEQCLLDVCDRELNAPDDQRQNVELAFNCCRAVILRCDGNEAPDVQPYLAAALFRRAQFLAQLGRPDDARRDFRDVATTWRDSTNPVVRRTMAANWLEAGQFEEDQGNQEWAQECYTKTMAYADDPDPVTQTQVARAQSNLGELLSSRGDLEQAVDVFDAAIQRWENHSDYWLRRAVANMRVYKAVALQKEGYYEDAIPLFEEAIAYADRAVDPPAYFIQAGAWLSKSSCLENLEHFEEVVACVDALEAWLIETVRPRPDYQKDVNKCAESSLDSAFLVKARCLQQLGRPEEALIAFDRSGNSVDDIVEDWDRRERACNIMLWRTKILAGLGRQEEAMDLYHQITRRTMSFGKKAWTPKMIMSLSLTLNYIKHGPD